MLCYPIFISYALLYIAGLAMYNIFKSYDYTDYAFESGSSGPHANPVVSVFRSLLSTYRFERNDPQLFVLCPVFLSHKSFVKSFNPRWQRCAMIVKTVRYSDGYHSSVELLNHHASQTYHSPIVSRDKNESMREACWYVYDCESIESQSLGDLLSTALDIMEVYLFYVNFAQAPSIAIKCMLVTQFLRARFLMLSYCFALDTLSEIEKAANNLENVFFNAKLAGDPDIQTDESTLGLVHLCEETKRLFPKASAAAEILRCVEKTATQMSEGARPDIDFAPLKPLYPGLYSMVSYLKNVFIAKTSSKCPIGVEVLEEPVSPLENKEALCAAFLLTMVCSESVRTVLSAAAEDPAVFKHFYGKMMRNYHRSILRHSIMLPGLSISSMPLVCNAAIRSHGLDLSKLDIYAEDLENNIIQVALKNFRTRSATEVAKVINKAEKDTGSIALSCLGSSIDVGKFVEVLEPAMEDVNYESFIDLSAPLTYGLDFLLGALQSPMIKPVLSLITLFVCYTMAPMSFSWESFINVNQDLSNTVVNTGPIVTQLIRGLRWIISSGIALYQGKLDLMAATNIDVWVKKATPYAIYNNPIGHLSFDPETGEANLSNFNFMYKLDTLLDEGKTVLAAAKIHNPPSIKSVTSLLAGLNITRSRVNTFMTSNAAKEACFAILIHGKSNICKTTLMDILRIVIQKRLNLTTDPAYTYVAPDSGNFFDGFRSSHHSMVLDDIAAGNPSSKHPDKSVVNVIKLMNNVPFNVEQAAIELKGTEFWTGKLLLATTNTLDLNAHAYFAYPEAALRRFPLILEVSPKAMDSEGRMLCPADQVEHGLSNWWRFKLYQRDLPKAGLKGQDFYVGDSILGLIEAIYERVDSHFIRQRQFIKTMHAHAEVEICDRCRKIQPCCNCPPLPLEFQSGVETASLDATSVSLMLFSLAKVIVPCLVLGLLFCLNRLYELFTTGKQASEALINSVNILQSACPRVVSSLERGAEAIAQVVPMVHNTAERVASCVGSVNHVVGVVQNVMPSSQNRRKLYSLVTIAAVITVLAGIINCLTSYKPSAFQTGSEQPPTQWVKDKCFVPLSIDSKTAAGAANYSERTGTVRKAMVKFYIFREGLEQATTCYGSYLGEPYFNCYMTTKHSLYGLNPDIIKLPIKEIVMVRQAGSLITGQNTISAQSIATNSVKFAPHNFQILEGKDDLAIIKLETAPHSLISKNGVYKYMLHSNFNGLPSDTQLVQPTDKQISIAKVEWDNKTCTDLRYFWADGYSEPGDCGSLLIGRLSNSFCILGIHNRGHVGRTFGLAQMVTQADIDSAMRALEFQGLSQDFPTLDTNYTVPPVGQDEFSLDFQPGLEPGDKYNYSLHMPDFIPENLDYIANWGRLDTFKSDVIPAPWQPNFSILLADVPKEDFKVAPNLSPTHPEFGWKPLSNYLRNVGAPVPSWDIERLHKAATCLVAYFTKRLCPEELKHGKRLSALSLEQTINGDPAIAGVTRIDMTTGFGLPENTPKKVQFDSLIVDGQMQYSLKPVQQQKFEQCLSSLEAGKALNFVCRGVRKDEPISLAKLKKRGPRLIFAAPTLMTLLLRRYFMPFIHLTFVARSTCGIAVGLNCDSVEWTHLYKWLTAFGSNCIAGDFGNFDQKLPAVVNGLALDVIRQVCIKVGDFSDIDQLAMLTLLKSTLNHHVLIDRSIFSVRGPNPSGQALTTHTNCVSVLLLLLYVWCKYYEPADFFTACRFTTYGDDHLVVVSPGYEKFNYDSIYTEMNQVNIDYTTFDKSSAQGKTYDDIHRVQFLKRSFEPRDGYCLAPLDLSSYYRRMYLTKRKTLNDSTAVLGVMSSLWLDSFVVSIGPTIRRLIHHWSLCSNISLPSNLFPTKAEFVARRLQMDQELTQYFGYPLLSGVSDTIFY